MTILTVEMVIRRLLEADLVGDHLEIAWHAGEPLVLPVSWYARAFESIERCLPSGVTVRNGFQTNATLIDDRWCALLRRTDVSLGVSLDGPAFIHDVHRRTRRGTGTHASVMAGVRRLRDADIDFHVIAVVTRHSLPHADAIIDFFLEENIRRIGFNIDENEGAHTESSLSDDCHQEFIHFFERVVRRVAGSDGKLCLREEESLRTALSSSSYGRLMGNAQNQPWAIVTVGWKGDITTFSPELLGLDHPVHGPLALGSIKEQSLLSIAASPRFTAISAEIAEGVRRCRASCGYFDVCLGGAPSNKLAELGRFDGTETMYCRLTQKWMTDILLRQMESPSSVRSESRLAGQRLSP